jgi:hypothetical protein
MSVRGVTQNSCARLSPASLKEEARGVVKTLRGDLLVHASPLVPERICLRRLRACADHSRATPVAPSCDSQGKVTPILIRVQSVAYRTRYSVDSSYLFLG